MNTAYRLIWDDLRNMLVIVDENSRARSKKAGKGGRRVALPAVLFTAALAGALVAPWGGEAWGSVCELYRNVTGNAVGTGANALACGTGASTTGKSRDIYQPGTYNLDPSDPDYRKRQNLRTDAGAYGRNDIAVGTGASAFGERKGLSIEEARAQGITTYDVGGYYTAYTSAEKDADKDNNQIGQAIAVGYQAAAVRANAVAVGNQSIAAGKDAIAIGRNARALTPNSVVIGGGNAGSVGIQGNGAINTPKDSPNKGGNSIAIGNANNFTYGYKNTDDYYANTKNSIAIGYRAHTHAANAFAIGVSTDATAERSFAIGTSSTSYKQDSSHQGTRAGGQGSLAFGDTAIVFAEDSTITNGDPERATNVKVNDAIAVGTNTMAQARNAVVVGGGMSYTYHDIDGNTMTNITKYYKDGAWLVRAEGAGANVGEGADGAVAIGGATADVTGMDNTYFPTIEADDLTVSGYTAAATIGKDATRAVAVGSGSKIGEGAENSVAVGARNVVTGKNSTAVGQANQVYGENSGAFGGGAQNTDENIVTGKNSYAVGYRNKVGKTGTQEDATTTDVFVVGGDNKIAQQTGDAGATSINVLGSTNTVQGSVKSENSSIVGNSNTVTTGLTNSLVAGNSNTGLNQVSNSQIVGNSNTKIGAKVSNLVVVGNSTVVTGGIDSAIGIGQETQILANYAIAMGNTAKAGGVSSIAIGNGAQTAANQSGTTAIGQSANAAHANAVALGSGSQTAAAVGTNIATVGNITYGTFAGTNPASVVSLGTTNSPRQLINVAAGRISDTSTDAINGSQLFAAYDQLQWQVGIGNAGGTNAGGALSQSTVGKLNTTTNKSNVQFLAGNGIDISKATITDGYGVKISAWPVGGRYNVNVQTIDDANTGKQYQIDAYKTTLTAGKGITLTPTGGFDETNKFAINYEVATDLNISQSGDTTTIVYDGKTYNITGDGGDENWHLSVNGGNKTIDGSGGNRNLVDSNTITVSYDNGDITFDAKTAELEVKNDGTAGIKTGDGSNLVTAEDVVDVVNNTYWTASDGKGGNTDVKAGSTVTFQGEAHGTDEAGITVENVGGRFTFKLDNVASSGDVQKPITFAGDTGSQFGRKLGETVNVVGGITDTTKLTDNNIGVVADGANTLTVKLAKDIDLTNNGSLSFGGPKITNVGGNLSVGGVKITNVAPGDISSTSTDAINGSQLQGVIDKGLYVNANEGGQQTQALQKQLSVQGGHGAELPTDGQISGYSGRNLATKVTQSGGNNTIHIQMSENPSFGRGPNKVTISGDNGSVTTTNGGQKTVVNPQGVTISGTGSYQPIVIQQGNVSMGGNRIRNVAPGVDDTDAVNVSQLKKQHINISDGRNTSGVYGGDTINFHGDRNIHVNVDGLDIHITLDPDLNVRSVTTGRARMDNDGFHIQNGPSVTVNGIDAAGMRITNVADGIHPYDAVNRGQLDALDNRLSNRIDKAYGGIATVAASVGVPQTTVPGSNMLGAALGGFEGETALAVGYSAMSDNGHWVWKNVLSASSEEFTWTTGLGYQW